MRLSLSGDSLTPDQLMAPQHAVRSGAHYLVVRQFAGAVIGVGTAFGSPDDARALRTAFGGARHGLKKSGSSSGRGRGHA